jgi:hypothetical protein
MACGRRQVSWLPACHLPRLPEPAEAASVTLCGWLIRLQWRDRAGFSPDFPSPPTVNGASIPRRLKPRDERPTHW